jgi:CheY-like chemotaxis protein
MTSKSQRRILAADADPSALGLIETYLEDQPFEVMPAAHGREALRLLKEDYPSFAAAVIAIALPGFDGVELLKKIKSDTRLSHIRVVLTVTADVSHGASAEGSAAGAVACLPKPFSKSQLLGVLRLDSLKGAPRPSAIGRPASPAGGSGYAVIHDGLGPATCHALADPSTTVCGRRVQRDRATEFTRERPPGTKACLFCNRA